MLNPDEMLALAETVPDPEPYIPLHEYGQAIDVLVHRKSMTYREIAEWLAEKGLNYTPSNVSNALATWRARNPRLALSEAP